MRKSSRALVALESKVFETTESRLPLRRNKSKTRSKTQPESNKKRTMMKRRKSLVKMRARTIRMRPVLTAQTRESLLSKKASPIPRTPPGTLMPPSKTSQKKINKKIQRLPPLYIIA